MLSPRRRPHLSRRLPGPGGNYGRWGVSPYRMPIRSAGPERTAHDKAKIGTRSARPQTDGASASYALRNVGPGIPNRPPQA